MALLKSFILLTLWSNYALGADVAHPAITAAPRAVKRQMGENCGYISANVLSALECPAGSTCFADPTLNVAGACCRLGDAANCAPATACVQQADLAQSCDGGCSANDRITKCSDSANPYCYTNYWVSGARTPLEIGCTTTQGYFAYVYTTYTGFGSVNFDVSQPTSSPIPTAQPTGSSGGGSNSGGGTAGTGSMGNAGTADSGSSSGGGISSPPAGAIAGGVVGGVAVLGIIAAVIVWIVLRHRRRSRSAAANTSIAEPQAGSSGGSGAEKPVIAASVSDEHSHQPVSPLSGTTAAPEHHEMSTQARSYELHNQQQRPVRKELPGRTVPELP